MTCLVIMMIIQKYIECKILGKQNWRMRILGANFGGKIRLISTEFSNKFNEKNWRMRTLCAHIFLSFLAGKFKIFLTALEDESLNSRENICFRLASSSWFSNLTRHILEKDSLLFCKCFLSFVFDLPFEVSETVNSQSVITKKNQQMHFVVNLALIFWAIMIE